MKIVWHDDSMLEKDWIRWLLGDLVTAEQSDPTFACMDDDTIHVISMVQHPLPYYASYFAACRKVCKNLILFHGSDEWASVGGYGVYKNFDAVIKNYHTRLAENRGILTVPLGYTNGTSLLPSTPPTSARSYVWSFLGDVKTTRMEMLSAFQGITPRFIKETNDGQRLNKQQYDDVLLGTMFMPCPMGNVATETFRLYEALEMGCIPLLERRLTLDYYKHLFGEHPIPVFHKWNTAAGFVEELTTDPTLMDATQRKISNWWIDYKSTLRLQIRSFLSHSYRDDLMAFSGQLRNRSAIVHEPLRVIEVLRHQSAANLAQRLSHPQEAVGKIWRNMVRRGRTR